MFLAPFMHDSAAVVAVISQMITPAIFILAAGNLINGSITRVARVVDRTRTLFKALPPEEADPAAYKAAMVQLTGYRRRARALESSLTAYYVAVGLFVAASLFVAISVFAPFLIAVPTVLSVAGAVSVFAGAMYSLMEIRIATNGLRREIDEEL